MDKGYLNGVVFLVVEKAFDCVDHKILVKKVLLYGCTDRTLKWFRSYLSYRSQMSKIVQCLSAKTDSMWRTAGFHSRAVYK